MYITLSKLLLRASFSNDGVLGLLKLLCHRHVGAGQLSRAPDDFPPIDLRYDRQRLDCYGEDVDGASGTGWFHVDRQALYTARLDRTDVRHPSGQFSADGQRNE